MLLSAVTFELYGQGKENIKMSAWQALKKLTEKYTEQVAGKNEGAAYFQQKQHISAD
jgi:hypothetical protein